MPLNDHVLLLQQERAIEALSDRLDDIPEPADVHCDCDCADGDYDELKGDLNALEGRMQDLEAGRGLEHIEGELTALRAALGEATDILVTLTRRFAELEARL